MAAPSASSLQPAAIAAQLWRSGSLVLRAAPGAGKTTQVPRALWEHPGRAPGQIWVVEPRRLAARMAANFVASQLGQACGDVVGYRVRDDVAIGPNTKLVYLTEGMLWRTLLAAPSLHEALGDVACIVLDEFHGRSLALDVALGVLAHLRAQGMRHAPAVLVMSATLDAAPIVELLGGAPQIDVAGRLHPVDVVHLPQPRGHTLEGAIVAGVRHVLMHEAQQHGNVPGWAGRDILAFLPGVRSIEAAQRQLTPFAERHGLEVCPLHARLDATAQKRALDPNGKRRIVLATNIAETSLTLPRVGIVLDGGVANVPVQEPLSGVVRLVEQAVSQAALTQRAGRAGRLAPGLCVRLFALADERRRPASEPPEVERLPLAEPLLWLAALKLPTLAALPLVTAPPSAALRSAHDLLVRLGALDASSQITPRGRRLVQLPVDARLGTVLLAAQDEGILALGCRAAAVLQDPPPRVSQVQQDVGTSDIWPLCQPRALSAEHRREAARLHRMFAGTQAGAFRPADEEAALARALLRGFCDRLAARQGTMGVVPGELPLAVALLGRARLAASSRVRSNALMVVLAAVPSTTAQAGWLVTLAAGVEPEWLVDLDDGRLREEEQLELRPGAGGERVVRMRYDGIVVYEQRQPVTDEQGRRALMQQRVRGMTPEQLLGAGQDERLIVRLALLAGWLPQLVAKLVPAPPAAALQADGMPARGLLVWARHHLHAQLGPLAEMAACDGRMPEGQALQLQLQNLWPQAVQAALVQQLPEEVRLQPQAKPLSVVYTQDAPPRITAPVQLFYGSEYGPALLNGRLPLVLALCGPHGRPLQLTRDLSRFWTEHYPSLRRALARRYPRHFWPEDPARAQPQVFVRRR